VQTSKAQLFRNIRLSAVIVIRPYGGWKRKAASKGCAAETKRLQIGLGACLRKSRINVRQQLAQGVQALSTDLLD
jgi:hypothetical protein